MEREHAMKIQNILQYLFVFTFVIAIVPAQRRAIAEQTATSPTHLSRHQLNTLVKNAKTSAQYQFLFCYFQQREQEYEKQAEQQRVEWANRFATFGYGGGMKNLSPQDSAKESYEYYKKKACQMKKRSKEFEQKMKSAGPPMSEPGAACPKLLEN